MNKSLVALVSTGLLASVGMAADTAEVAWPEGYRAWRHVKSMVIEAGHPLHAAFGGIHHINRVPPCPVHLASAAGAARAGAWVVFVIVMCILRSQDAPVPDTLETLLFSVGTRIPAIRIFLSVVI